eukprot:6222835-Amphidinium_carterae.2
MALLSKEQIKLLIPRREREREHALHICSPSQKASFVRLWWVGAECGFTVSRDSASRSSCTQDSKRAGVSVDCLLYTSDAADDTPC